MNKKGYLDLKYMMGIIMGMLLLFVFFSSFFVNYKQEFEQKAYSETCNQYIKLHLFGKRGILEVNLDDFPCKTENVLIEVGSDYELMKDVSNKVVECTNSYYRGKEEMFTGEKGNEIKFCGVCHNINFDNPNKTISTIEWLSFQSTAKHESGESFLEILATKDFSEGFIDNLEQNKASAGHDMVAIDTSEEYVTVFTYDKKEAPSRFEKIVKGAAIGAAVGAVGAVVIIATGGSATPIVAGIIAAKIAAGTGAFVGGGIAYQVSHTSQNGDVWISEARLEEFNSTNLKELECDVIIGMQEPGITSMPYDE